MKGKVIETSIHIWPSRKSSHFKSFKLNLLSVSSRKLSNQILFSAFCVFLAYEFLPKFIDWRWLSRGETFALVIRFLFHTFWHIVSKNQKKNFHRRNEKKIPFSSLSTRFIYFICLSYLSSIIKSNTREKQRKLGSCLTFLHFIISFNSKRYRRDQFEEKLASCCICCALERKNWNFHHKILIWSHSDQLFKLSQSSQGS